MLESETSETNWVRYSHWLERVERVERGLETTLRLICIIELNAMFRYWCCRKIWNWASI